MPKYTISCNPWNLSMVGNWIGCYHTRATGISSRTIKLLWWNPTTMLALAKVSGYPLASIKSGTQFKQTHKFLLEVWRQCIGSCLASSLHLLPQMVKKVINPLQTWSHGPFYQYGHSLMNSIQNLLEWKPHLKVFNNSNIQPQATVDNTRQFWTQFVFQDCMAYIGVFLAIRSGDWNLRMACIKHMAPIHCIWSFNLPTAHCKTYQWCSLHATTASYNAPARWICC